MLFELDDDHLALKPVPFDSFGDHGRSEKHLEELVVKNLLDVLFQQTPLLTFHQERPFQAVADIYALNQHGDIVIFELKLNKADSGALDQILRYAGEAGRWTYAEIERRLRNHYSDEELSLVTVHAETFNLNDDDQLDRRDFNREQHLWIVGHAADDELIRTVDYWKSKGLSIDFFPYRLYNLNSRTYLEFFSKPYDAHPNPALRKGVLFDTNGSRDYEPTGYGCLRDMLHQKRISAYGTRKEAVRCFQPGDLVFYSHVGVGVVGAARITGPHMHQVRHPYYGDEWYWNVALLTPVPKTFADIPAIPFSDVSKLLDKSFFWARVDKRPYLSYEESQRLLNEEM